MSGAGTTVRCENFRTTEVVGGKTHKTWNQDKGQATAIERTLQALREGGPSPIPLEEIAAVSAATFAIVRSLESGSPEEVDAWEC